MSAADPDPARAPSRPAPSTDDWLRLWYERGDDFAVIFLAPDATVVGANPAVQTVLGYRPDELLGQTLQRIFTPEDRERGLDRHELALAVRAGRAEDDRWHLGKGDRRVWVSGVLMALRDGTGAHVGFAKVMRNRTDLRGEIESLQNRLADAEAAAVRQDNALTTLGHEIRNPLNTLGNAFSVLQQGHVLTDKLVAVISRQLAALQRLMDDLREASRVRQGRAGALQLADVDLQALIGATVALHEPEARARRQTLQAVLPAPPIVVQADAIRLEQILRNLLDNAVKYTPQGGRIIVSATIEGEIVVMRVEDDGIGISQETLPRIFELFAREGRAPDAPVEGLGVGLAVVRDLVRQHHGIVEVRSAGPDRGSVFTIRLPLRQLPTST